MTQFKSYICFVLLLIFGVHVQAQNPDKNRIKDISFDTIKFDIEKDAPFKPEMLTKEINALEGQLVRIRGYMLPSFQQSGIKKFVLVRDNICLLYTSPSPRDS